MVFKTIKIILINIKITFPNKKIFLKCKILVNYIYKGPKNKMVEHYTDTIFSLMYPYFTDKVANQNTDRHYFYCSAGDAFIFDSKLWHGSDENHVGTDRFAYVTRWVIEGKGFPEIPAIKPAAFGMFNCGNLTQEIMKKALSLFDLELEKTATNKGELITIWLDILAKSPNIWGVDSHTATRDLKNLHILNNAYELHDAGNISGGVYKDLWFSLLSSLNNKIQLIEAMEHKN
jgi:hypothetical protein